MGKGHTDIIKIYLEMLLKLNFTPEQQLELLLAKKNDEGNITGTYWMIKKGNIDNFRLYLKAILQLPFSDIEQLNLAHYISAYAENESPIFQKVLAEEMTLYSEQKIQPPNPVINLLQLMSAYFKKMF
jgi:hypothetical protein